jgi:hypothetical protein
LVGCVHRLRGGGAGVSAVYLESGRRLLQSCIRLASEWKQGRYCCHTFGQNDFQILKLDILKGKTKQSLLLMKQCDTEPPVEPGV